MEAPSPVMSSRVAPMWRASARPQAPRFGTEMLLRAGHRREGDEVMENMKVKCCLLLVFALLLVDTTFARKDRKNTPDKINAQANVNERSEGLTKEQGNDILQE